jgi:hypothetical protein
MVRHLRFIIIVSAPAGWHITRPWILITCKCISISTSRSVCHHLRASRLFYNKRVASIAVSLVYKDLDAVGLLYLISGRSCVITNRSLFLLGVLASLCEWLDHISVHPHSLSFQFF